MKLRKLFVILLALLVVFSFVACDGSGGGSDDNGSTNGDNGGTNGDNGGNGGGNEDPPALTWPVSYRADLHALYPENPEGSFAYVNFNENTYEFGNCIDGITPIKGGDGTYSGDPHNDGTIYITGDWTFDGPPEPVEDYPIVITGGTFEYASITVTRQ